MSARHSALTALALLLACAGCHALPPSVTNETLPSPDGRAALATLGRTATGVAQVVLVVAGDTTEVLGPTDVPRLSSEWLGPDLGRIWLPIGGNYNHASVFVQPSTRRHSSLLDNDIAVDALSGTVVTYDGGALTLRDLWTGTSNATWSPPGLDLIQIWQACNPNATRAGRTLTLRYDCGDGERVHDVVWSLLVTSP